MAVVAQSLVAGNAEGVFQIGVIYLFWPFFRFARALAPFHPARIAYEQQKKYVYDKKKQWANTVRLLAKTRRHRAAAPVMDVGFPSTAESDTGGGPRQGTPPLAEPAAASPGAGVSDAALNGPRPVRRNETIRVALRDVQEQVSCSVCLGILRKTTMSPCTHRFCKDCIESALRNTKNECPLCRVHISTKRALKHDSNFDLIIAALYPNLDEFDAAELVPSRQVTAVRNATMQGLDRQLSAQGPPLPPPVPAARLPKAKPEPRLPRPAVPQPPAAPRPAKAPKPAAKDDDYFFVLRRHPHDFRGGEKPLTREYIRTK